jgi:hypothetical protein
MKDANAGNDKRAKKGSRFGAALAVATPLVMLGLLALGVILAIWRLSSWAWQAIVGN